MGAVLGASAWLRTMAQAFMRSFANSDYLAGVLAMSAMGMARDASARACKLLFAWIVQQLWVTVRLEEKDAELVLAWLRDRPEVHASHQLTLYSQRSAQGHSRVYEYEPEIQVTTRLRCSLQGGQSQWIWVTRRERGDGQGDRHLPGAHVTFFGRNKGMLENILEAGREIQRRRREKYLTVVQVYDYGKEHGLNWLHPQEKDRKQPGRSISSVVLPRCPFSGLDQAEALLEDAREFLNSELWYTERGIPYRRGYLLHGVPGGGKSSLVMAVASELRLPIYMLQLSSARMSDETLNTLLQYGMHDPPTILLLEDVDLLHSAVLHRRAGVEKEEPADPLDDFDKISLRGDSDPDRKRRGGRLTLSGLLNALDGPTATTGRLLFMTTNARNRLDPALLRSGRIDYEVEFREAEREQIERLFVRFYSDFGSGRPRTSSPTSPSTTAEGGAGTDLEAGHKTVVGSQRSAQELAHSFAEQVTASGVQLTTADIQRHLMGRKTDPQRALSELPALLKAIDKRLGPGSGSIGNEAAAAGGDSPQPDGPSQPESLARNEGPSQQEGTPQPNGPSGGPEQPEAEDAESAAAGEPGRAQGAGPDRPQAEDAEVPAA